MAAKHIHARLAKLGCGDATSLGVVDLEANVGHEGGKGVGECGGRQGGGHLDENVIQVGPHFGSGVECSKPFQGGANAAREEEGAQWVTLPGARGGQQRRDARGGGGEQLRGLLIQQREQGECLSQVLRQEGGNGGARDGVERIAHVHGHQFIVGRLCAVDAVDDGLSGT